MAMPFRGWATPLLDAAADATAGAHTVSDFSARLRMPSRIGLGTGGGAGSPDP